MEVGWQGKTLSMLGFTHRKVNKNEDLSLFINILFEIYLGIDNAKLQSSQPQLLGPFDPYIPCFQMELVGINNVYNVG